MPLGVMMVDILVATYNGERYIASQLHSLLGQTYSDIRILVHDDGSTDGTIDIVRNMAKIDGRILLISDNIKCRDAGKNFLHLLKYSSSDFIMFCDQDDIWFDNKVEVMLNEAKKHENQIPLVIYSNSYVWNPDKGVEGLATKIWVKTLKDFIFLNGGVQGCAAMFNKRMRDEMLKWEGGLSMHDHLLQLIGAAFGKIVCIDTVLMLYRRHRESVTAALDMSSSFADRLIKNKEFPVVSQKHYDTIKTFYKIYANEMSEYNCKLMSEYLIMMNVSFLKKIIIIIKNKFCIYNSISLLILKILLRRYVK